MTVEAVGLRKRYGDRVALVDLTFTAGPGEVIGLLGPNGAGKTTAIRLLSTVIRPTGGEFAIAGVPSSRPVEIRRRVGVLPESAGYPANQTGAGYLRYHARLFGLDRTAATRLARTLLAEVGLAERADSRIGGYSRGMRQRLGIARALVNEPVVVFLDEPTLGLDPAGQRQVLDLIRAMARDRGATVVLSTHTLPDVEEACGRVVILHRGRVRAAGSVGDVVRAAGARPARVRVPADQAGRAAAVVSATIPSGVDGGRPEVDAAGGEVRFSVAAPDGANEALGALLAAGVPVLSYELESARLSEAFLEMTTGEGAP